LPVIFSEEITRDKIEKMKNADDSRPMVNVQARPPIRSYLKDKSHNDSKISSDEFSRPRHQEKEIENGKTNTTRDGITNTTVDGKTNTMEVNVDAVGTVGQAKDSPTQTGQKKLGSDVPSPVDNDPQHSKTDRADLTNDFASRMGRMSVEEKGVKESSKNVNKEHKLSRTTRYIVSHAGVTPVRGNEGNMINTQSIQDYRPLIDFRFSAAKRNQSATNNAEYSKGSLSKKGSEIKLVHLRGLNSGIPQQSDISHANNKEHKLPPTPQYSVSYADVTSARGNLNNLNNTRSIQDRPLKGLRFSSVKRNQSATNDLSLDKASSSVDRNTGPYVNTSNVGAKRGYEDESEVYEEPTKQLGLDGQSKKFKGVVSSAGLVTPPIGASIRLGGPFSGHTNNNSNDGGDVDEIDQSLDRGSDQDLFKEPNSDTERLSEKGSKTFSQYESKKGSVGDSQEEEEDEVESSSQHSMCTRRRAVSIITK